MLSGQLRREVEEARAFLSARIDVFPRIGVILGSGLGYLVEEMSNATMVPYAQIPHFALTSVDGHDGVLASGMLDGVGLVALKGRSHFYEGTDMRQLTLPVRVLAAVGIETLLVTNAAGGLNRAFRPGDLMIMTDHINILGMAGGNPLVGINDPALGERFLDMSGAYDPHLVALAESVGLSGGTPIHKGVYVMVAGPSYETPAEIGFLRTIGGDAVGMSTVPEVIVARQCGLKVIGISCISNVASRKSESTSHEQVLAGVEAAKPTFADFLKKLLKRM